MKQFFTIVFGGLGAIAAGMLLAYGGSHLWNAAGSAISHMPSLSTLAASVLPQPVDGTVISGVTRTVRYTASEEEDLIDAATRALPHAADSSVTAKAYIVKDLTTGEVVAQRSADQLLPIASLSKLVTAVVAQKNIPPESHITITRSIMSTYGNTAQFKAGEAFTAGDLYYPLLMVSSNDAAEAFAQSFGRAQFIRYMNDFAQSIGAYRTYFADPSGLSPQNVSSANDIALLLNWIRANSPDILSITELKTKTVRSHTWINPTHFLNWSNYLGGKNGYLPEADRTGAALFSIGKKGDVYAIVILGSSNRDADVVKLLGKLQ